MAKQSNPWKINNRRWLESRQTRWAKRIQPQLKELSRFWVTFLQPYDLPFLKAYFIKGEILDYDEKWFGRLDYATQRRSSHMLGTPYQLPVLFKVWFYPEENEKLFEQWCNEATSYDLHYYETTARNSSSCGHEKMEFFAGRSYYLDRFLVPKTFDGYSEVIYNLSKLGFEDRHIKEQQMPMLRLMLLVNIFTQKISCLAGKGRFPFVFAHELFVDLLKEHDLTTKDPKGGRNLDTLLKNVIDLILHRDIRDFYPRFPLIEKLKKEMTEQFEQGITPEIDAIWKEAQKGPLVLTKN